jgi:hypothetical protein
MTPEVLIVVKIPMLVLYVVTLYGLYVDTNILEELSPEDRSTKF